MSESRFDAYLIFLYDGLRCADVPLPNGRSRAISLDRRVRSATRVPKEINEKHELLRPCRDSGCPNAGTVDGQSSTAIGYIQDLHFKPVT